MHHGENSSKPHAVPTDRIIQEQDIITIDMGCKINGYCSDMTRTIFVGAISKEQQKIYDLVLNNQKKALDEIYDGANIKTIVKSVESDFNLYNQTLVHALGHGVGLDIHELPSLAIKNDNILKENMVVNYIFYLMEQELRFFHIYLGIYFYVLKRYICILK